MAKRGRPSVEPTAEEREKIKLLLESKASLADIAKMVSHSIPWIRIYFPKELKSRSNSRRGEGSKWTPALAKKVVRYIGCKMNPDQVARALGMTVGELKASFAEEIRTGNARYRARVLDSLDEQMAAGVVGATNRLEALTVITDPQEQPGAERQGPNLGKKAASRAAAAAAASGGGTFAPPPPPRLAIDNTKKT